MYNTKPRPTLILESLNSNVPDRAWTAIEQLGGKHWNNDRDRLFP